MSGEISRQSMIDEEHLKLLSLGYMISAGVSAFFSLFGLLYVLMGVIMSAAFSHMPEIVGKKGQEPPTFIGWIFAGIGLAIFVLLVALAIAKSYAALCIKRRKARIFCMVVAGISCLEVPYGTVLGVFSFIVLGRDSIIRLFTPAAPS